MSHARASMLIARAAPPSSIARSSIAAACANSRARQSEVKSTTIPTSILSPLSTPTTTTTTTTNTADSKPEWTSQDDFVDEVERLEQAVAFRKRYGQAMQDEVGTRTFNSPFYSPKKGSSASASGYEASRRAFLRTRWKERYETIEKLRQEAGFRALHQPPRDDDATSTPGAGEDDGSHTPVRSMGGQLSWSEADYFRSLEGRLSRSEANYVRSLGGRISMSEADYLDEVERLKRAVAFREMHGRPMQGEELGTRPFNSPFYQRSIHPVKEGQDSKEGNRASKIRKRWEERYATIEGLRRAAGFRAVHRSAREEESTGVTMTPTSATSTAVSSSGGGGSTSSPPPASPISPTTSSTQSGSGGGGGTSPPASPTSPTTSSTQRGSGSGGGTSPPPASPTSPTTSSTQSGSGSGDDAPPPPPPRSKGHPVLNGRNALFAIALGLFGAANYALGAFYPPEAVMLLFPRPVPDAPTPGTEEAEAYTAKLEEDMLRLPHVRQLLASRSTPADDAATTNATGNHYVLSRPFLNFPAHLVPHSLTAGSLRKPGMLAVAPVVLSKTRHGAATLGGAQGDAYAFLHLGRSLCGHDGIVHGGLLATILDETLARTAFFRLPHKIGVTARLEIDYKRPVRADSVVEVETRVVESHGRKAWVEATMRDLHGQTLAVSKALFVEPRLVAWLDTSAVAHVMDRSDE